MLNVPVGWEVKQLGDVAVINPGINKSMSHMGSGVLYVTVQDLYSGDSIDIKRLGRIRLSTQEVDSYALQPRDIIFGKSSVKREGIAYPNIFRGALEPVVCTGFSYMVRALPELADADFLLHALRWSPTRKWLIEHSQASALTNINKAISDAIPITLPPLEEQQRIGTILSDMDAHANAMARLLAKKKAVKAAMAEELLTGKRRLEGFSGAWKVLAAKEIGSFSGGNGFPLSAQGKTNGDYPFFKVSDMNHDGNETFMITSNHYISEHVRAGLGVKLFPEGTIVFAKVGAAVFLERKKILKRPSCIDNNIAAFVVNKELADVGYVHAFLLNTKIGALVNTTALPSLNAKILGEMTLVVPPLPEQTAIATILSDMDADIHALAKKLEKHKKLKEAMAHQLLTGAIRV